MYHYSSPPPVWSDFDYTTSPPPTSPHYPYYSSQFVNPHVSPRSSSKRHNRKASYATTKDPGGWHSGYQSFQEAMPEYAPPRKHETVSAHFGGKEQMKQKRRYSIPRSQGLGYSQPNRSRSQRQPIFMDAADDAQYQPEYVYREPRGTRSGHDPRSTLPPGWAGQTRRGRNQDPYSRKPRPTTNDRFYSYQVPGHDDANTPKRSRTRRASTSAHTPPKPKMPPKPKPPPRATEEDAIRAGIPSGYSIKNWDPAETPIILLGSVFDANSLGKWIYDWTIFYHGASTPIGDVAGDLWLLLIRLSCKMKRADECLDRIRSPEAREILEEFMESGGRLWARFKKLLKACEHYMWKAAKRDGGSKGNVLMGRNAGCEFVESIFGRDRELENTEKLMNSVRLWDMRFDANCEAILR